MTAAQVKNKLTIDKQVNVVVSFELKEQIILNNVTKYYKIIIFPKLF